MQRVDLKDPRKPTATSYTQTIVDKARRAISLESVNQPRGNATIQRASSFPRPANAPAEDRRAFILVQGVEINGERKPIEFPALQLGKTSTRLQPSERGPLLSRASSSNVQSPVSPRSWRSTLDKEEGPSPKTGKPRLAPLSRPDNVTPVNQVALLAKPVLPNLVRKLDEPRFVRPSAQEIAKLEHRPHTWSPNAKEGLLKWMFYKKVDAQHKEALEMVERIKKGRARQP